MSMCDRRGRKVQKQLQLKLQEVKQLFPIHDGSLWLVDFNTATTTAPPPSSSSATTPAVEPRLIFPHEKPKKETLEMLQVLFRMKNVVLSFAETFEESDCPTIHVRGERTLFSCYRVGQLYLGFYSDAANERELFVDADREQKMREICEDLSKLLVSV